MAGCAYFLFFIYITTVKCEDLTVVPEETGTDVVIASIAKISDSLIFSKDDQQFLRRIAFVETTDGLDETTYADSNNNGGIWQLSNEKYQETKTGTDNAILQKINDIFQIDWATTTWVDLRKPFFSALASRLYLELVLITDYPFSTDIPSQAKLWSEVFTNSDKDEADYIAGTIKLSQDERKYRTIDLIKETN